MSKFNDFTGLYPISKTIRFELIPQGKTLEYIEKDGMLSQDEHRADSYIIVKKIIDEYHKVFIANALDGFSMNGLEDYFLYYQIQKRSEEEKKKFEEIQAKLRKQIADRFKEHTWFSRIDKKELIKEDLYRLNLNEDQKKLVEEFDSFTTYFTGFHENRKNMYSADEKSTAIAYRLIHQNLPKFIDNMRAFDKVRNSPVNAKFETILSDVELGPVIQVVAVQDMFKLEYFNETLTQLGIDTYNHLIGGFTAEDGKEKVKGLNEYINLFNQNAPKEDRLPKLKPLYKQILSDRSTASFIPEEFTNDSEVLESLEKFYQEINEQVLNRKVEGEHSLKDLLQNLNEYDLTKIYLRNDLGLTDISQKMFSDWGVLPKALNQWFDQNYKGKAKAGTEKYEEEQKKYFSNHDSFSIGFLNECLSISSPAHHQKIENYFGQLGEVSAETENLFSQLQSNYLSVKDLLNNPYPQGKDLAQDQKNVEQIKVFLDSIKSLQWFIKPLLGRGNEADKDERFYGEFSMLWTTLDQITPLYNKVRNYMTRKPYSTEKMKLNFENSTLLDGWDVNKEADNASLIFRKDGLYYLGIMNKKHNKIFRKDNEPGDGAFYEKMEYKLLPGANKMLPKVFFSNSRIAEFNPGIELMENYKNETHKKGENFNLKHCHILIDFFKSSIQKHEDWKKFGFRFSDTASYEDLSGFYREVEQQGYKITFRPISESYMNQLVEEGKLYLFQIYNKDFSPNSKGTPNLHTLYWKMLFDAGNLKNVVYKLNGQAEVFYRKSSIKTENRIVHKANQPIANKNELNTKKQSNFAYDIVKDRRFTVDKFQFHVPITMNFKARGLNNINTEVNQFLKTENDIHIIGIDRGERHLLYLTLIDSSGNIKQQFSINEIVNEYEGKTYRTNYHALLDKKEGGRDDARRNWKTIESIKELKEGYLSQVIHKIAELMVEYKAIVVLEDLNMGFMRGRQKVEKQVYQKFEKMLIDKLNYLVDKNMAAMELGGTLNAYQLTNKFESFQKMGKQSGLLFYVPAWNTSKIDPVTGFVNLFDTRYENVPKSKSFFNKFKSVKYNHEKDYFEFELENYSAFSAKAEGTRQNWVICSHGNRIINYGNPEKNHEWNDKTVILSEEFKAFFNARKIEFENGNCIKDKILQQSDTDKGFYESLLKLFKLTLQMRNSKIKSDVDYLISPVADRNGDFYQSEIEKKKGKNENENWVSKLPVDADANGAYNIARKGLWVVEQIKQTSDMKKLRLAISNKEWLNFIQNQK
jgi:CRISPR-associated protein Cpf1